MVCANAALSHRLSRPELDTDFMRSLGAGECSREMQHMLSASNASNCDVECT